MKKKSLLIILFLVSTKLILAQPWLKNLPNSRSNSKFTFFDYQKAFYSYWDKYNVQDGYYIENGETKKAYGWKQFKRWEHEMNHKVNLSNGEFPSFEHTFNEDFLNYGKNTRTTVADGASWNSAGPDKFSGGRSGSGRINCIAFHPTDTSIFWIGSSGGGVWLTIDGGSKWKPLTDNIGVLGISDIVITSDYETSKTLYIATGDKDSFDNESVGVLKSTDGGVTWKTTGLKFSRSDRKFIFRLLLDPNNNNHLVAATSNGLYTTFNGGERWFRGSLLSFDDIEASPNDFSKVYASSNDGKIFLLKYPPFNFKNVFDTLWDVQQVYSNSNAGRIDLEVSANTPNSVYALACDNLGGLFGYLKSVNGGSNYSVIYGTNSANFKNLLASSNEATEAGGQGFYDLTIAVSPNDSNKIFIGGINTWTSDSGGTGWYLLNTWKSHTTAQLIHSDKHKIKYRRNTLFECNDGGLIVSYNNGVKWNDLTNGLVIGNHYKLNVFDSIPTRYITGMQDIGVKEFNGNDWSDVHFADGMNCFYDSKNDTVRYYSIQNGKLYRKEGNADPVRISPPNRESQGAWITPFAIDPSNNTTIYAAYRQLYFSKDKGQNWDSITGLPGTRNLTSLVIHPSTLGNIYFVSDGLKIWKSAITAEISDNYSGDGFMDFPHKWSNGVFFERKWTEITGNLNFTGSLITSLTVKNDNPSIMWVTLSSYNSNRILESRDGGATWFSISEGLPSMPVYSLIQNKQSVSSTQLYAATEMGIYFKNGSEPWKIFSFGLPNVSVRDLDFAYNKDPKNTLIIAATYGRGIWKSPVMQVCSSTSEVISNNSLSGTQQVCGNSTSQFSSTIKGGVWSSLDTAIAKIDISGKITGNKAGTTNIKYTTTSPAGCPTFATRAITIEEPAPQTIISGPDSICLYYSPNYTANISGGVWKSSNDSIAFLTGNGIFVTRKPGTVNITYTISGKAVCPSSVSSKSLTVKDYPSGGIITGAQFLCVGATSTYKSDKTGGSWNSSATDVATVDYRTGILTAKKAGTITLTYKLPVANSMCKIGISTFKVQISSPPAPAVISGIQEVCQGLAVQLKASITGGKWKSSQITTATVDSINGMVKGVKAGSTTITYTIAGKGCKDTLSSKSITVSAPVSAGDLTVSSYMCINNTANFKSSVIGGQWNSSDTSVLSISTVGLVKAKKSGSSLVSYTVLGKGGCPNSTKSLSVTVSAPLPAITISGLPTLCKGTTTILNSNIKGGKWTTSNASFVSVDPVSGKISGIGSGVADITYSVPGAGCTDGLAKKSISVVLPVSAGTLSGTQFVAVGKTTTFASTVKGGKWSSTDPTTATVSPDLGVVKGLKMGSTSIQYTVPSINVCPNSTATRIVSVNFALLPFAKNGNPEIETASTLGNDFIQDVKYYPNPSTGAIYFENIIEGVDKINLTDLSGRIVRSELINNEVNMADFSGVEPGVYLLQFVGKEFVKVKQLVIMDK